MNRRELIQAITRDSSVHTALLDLKSMVLFKTERGEVYDVTEVNLVSTELGDAVLIKGKLLEPESSQPSRLSAPMGAVCDFCEKQRMHHLGPEEYCSYRATNTFKERR